MGEAIASALRKPDEYSDTFQSDSNRSRGKFPRSSAACVRPASALAVPPEWRRAGIDRTGMCLLCTEPESQPAGSPVLRPSEAWREFARLRRLGRRHGVAGPPVHELSSPERLATARIAVTACRRRALRGEFSYRKCTAEGTCDRVSVFTTRVRSIAACGSSAFSVATGFFRVHARAS